MTKAIDLIKKHIPNPLMQQSASVLRILPGDSWYHIHHDEEVPQGHIQIILSTGATHDLYNPDGYNDSPNG